MLKIVRELREVEAAIDTGSRMPHDPAAILADAAARLEALGRLCREARKASPVEHISEFYPRVQKFVKDLERELGVEPLTDAQKVERVQALIDECRTFAVREGEPPVVSMDALIEALNG